MDDITLVKGRNTSNNTTNIINITDDGNIKLDETTVLSNIYSDLSSSEIKLGTINSNVSTLVTDLDSLKVNNIDRTINIQYQRSLGRCFSAFSKGVFDNTNTNEPNNSWFFYTLFNNASIDKTIYLYNVNMTIADNTGNNSGFHISMYYIDTAPTANLNVATPANNLKIGSSTCDATLYETGQNMHPSISSSDIIMRQASSFSTDTTFEEFQFTNLYEEMVEIPSGYGVTFSYGDDTGAPLGFDYAINLRFAEIPN